MIVLDNNSLECSVPEVHEEACCSISFQRTLRIPDDGSDYPLPPGFGCFSLRHLDDYANQLSAEWSARGGILMPMHQAEAMWINFSAHAAYPFAVKVATGKVCAITGDSWVDHLNSDPQDYLVLPDQPWLDGYCVDNGVIRQFVAMPLGDGYTVEEQLTGAAEHGGLQIAAYPMKRERYEALMADRSYRHAQLEESGLVYDSSPMGLAPGGRMKQDIYEDPHGLDAWDQRHVSRCYVTILNSAQWLAVTGEIPPDEPPTAQQYTDAGLPWFDYYREGPSAVPGATRLLKRAKSVAQTGAKKGASPLPHNETLTVRRRVRLGARVVRRVRECF